jgi:hypothetical protein
VYQNLTDDIKKYTKLPNIHEMHQNFTSQSLPEIGIFGMKIYHLATPELN